MRYISHRDEEGKYHWTPVGIKMMPFCDFRKSKLAVIEDDKFEELEQLIINASERISEAKIDNPNVEDIAGDVVVQFMWKVASLLEYDQFPLTNELKSDIKEV